MDDDMDPLKTTYKDESGYQSFQLNRKLNFFLEFTTKGHTKRQVFHTPICGNP